MCWITDGDPWSVKQHQWKSEAKEDNQGSGWFGGQGGCERNVGGDVVYGRYELKIEGIVQCTKRYCTILRKLKKCGGRGRGYI